MRKLIGIFFIAMGIDGLLSNSSSQFSGLFLVLGLIVLFSKFGAASEDGSFFDFDFGSDSDSDGGGDGGDGGGGD